MSSYGHHQEQAAAGLLALLQHPPRPDRDLDPPTAAHAAPGTTGGTTRGDTIRLQLREQVRLALLERVTLIGGGDTFDVEVDHRPHTAGRDGVHLLAKVLHATPSDHDRLLPQEPPSVLLTTPLADVDLEQWRGVARSLMLGNHELHDQHHQWSTQPPQRWAVLAHTAESLEALLVVDQHLQRRAGGYADLTPGPRAWGPRGDRAVCASVARDARQHATPPRPGTGLPSRTQTTLSGDQAADHITSLLHPRHTDAGTSPVLLVRDNFEDLALAETNLARQLRYNFPRTETATQADLSIRDGRALLLGQVILNGELAALLERHRTTHRASGEAPDRPPARLGFARRSQELLAAVNASRSWVDASATEDRSASLHQQHEITRAARRIPSWPLPSARMLRELDGAAHQAAVNLALTMRQQVGRGSHFLTRAPTELDSLTELTKVPRQGALYRRLTDLAHAAAPYASPVAAPLSRAALRRVLADTPSLGRRPTLRPALHPTETPARGLDVER